MDGARSLSCKGCQALRVSKLSIAGFGLRVQGLGVLGLGFHGLEGLAFRVSGFGVSGAIPSSGLHVFLADRFLGLRTKKRTEVDTEHACGESLRAQQLTKLLSLNPKSLNPSQPKPVNPKP